MTARRRQAVHEPAGCATEAILIAAFAGTAAVCVTGSWWGVAAVGVLVTWIALQLWAGQRTQRQAARQRHPTRHLRPVNDPEWLHRPDDQDGAA